MRITYGDESGILGHAERHIICSGKKQGISISVSRLMYIRLHIHIISIYGDIFYVFLNWVLINVSLVAEGQSICMAVSFSIKQKFE